MTVNLLESPVRPTIVGLEESEVAARLAQGEANVTTNRTSRSVAEILRANFFTRFNALLGALLLVMLIIGPPQDALFGLVLVANLVIGIGQELRAKLTLDRLAVVYSPRATVIRGGARQSIPVAQLVKDDCIELQRGDQIPVDGRLVVSDGLEVDESLLTGESQPLGKQPGEGLLSGSIVTAGFGIMRATAVGPQAYARRLADEARRFTLVRSELRDGINRILRAITWIIPPAALLLIVSQLRANDHLVDAIRGAVAGTVTLVPEGLVLLTSLAMAVAVIRLARRRALVQELPAVEGLARVDVVCLDKTGTLTDGKISVEGLDLLGPNGSENEIRSALASLAGSGDDANPSVLALRAAYTGPGPAVQGRVPFSSARKWSAIVTAEGQTWLLGAHDVVGLGHPDAQKRAEAHAASGSRVLMLVKADGPLVGDMLPAATEAQALVLLSERLRADVQQTLTFLAREGVRLKVISGDHPATLGAIAAAAGLPARSATVDSRLLSDGSPELADLAEQHDLFGRTGPRQKRDLVHALKSRGHVVAMVGDGVNDVLALKEADIGIAMASGSPAGRAVAQIVLLSNDISTLPAIIAEGRRVIANVERLANLFITKTVYAFLLAMAIGVMAFPFPFLPRHLTLVGSLSIGIPAFFLALAPNARRSHPGFVNRVLRFSIPAGLVAATATFGAYALVLDSPYASFAEAQTMATMVLVGTGLWLLSVLARPFTIWKGGLIATMIAALILILALPTTRHFFALDVPSALVTLAALGIVALAGAAIEVGWRISRWEAGLHRAEPQTLERPGSGR